MSNNMCENKRLNIYKLISFGFCECEGMFTYSTIIADEQFQMHVSISKSGEIKTKIIDLDSKYEYVLHLMSDAVGAFVGKIKAEYERVLSEIVEQCFDSDVFKGNVAKDIATYAKDKYGSDLEFLWERFSNNAVLRRKDTGKWYAALLLVTKRKLGIDSDDTIEIIDFRVAPSELEKLIDNKKYFSGYHMNKKHWCTVILDGSVPTEDIFARIDNSYALAK